jgi:hypothetical protein
VEDPNTRHGSVDGYGPAAEESREAEPNTTHGAPYSTSVLITPLFLRSLRPLLGYISPVTFHTAPGIVWTVKSGLRGPSDNPAECRTRPAGIIRPVPLFIPHGNNGQITTSISGHLRHTLPAEN